MLDGHVELELPAEPSSPQIAREAIARLGALPPDLLDRAQLITSELVTNGVRHGNARAGAHIRLSAELHPSFLRIEVTSPPAPSRPTMQARGELRSSGYGLIIVDALADRWGSSVDGAVRVWCELGREPKPAAGQPSTFEQRR
jgi:anti-sigma regulatory factor (Ser/Thr protein kinase)